MAVRDIVLAYLCGNLEAASELRDVCADTAAIYGALEQGLPADSSRIDIGGAGTAMRFLCAIAATTPGVHCMLTGNERMQQRPIAPLVDALRHLGADIEYVVNEGFPPLVIRGKKLAGGEIEIAAGISSQFISALMLVTPLMSNSLNIRLLGDLQSAPYIKMTASMMEHHGVGVDYDRDKIHVPAAKYQSAPLLIERDWSAAAFWYEIAALTAGWVTLEGLTDKSLQGDRAEAPLFERLGVITDFEDGNAELSATPDLWNSLDADLSDMPDAVPALCVTAALAGIPFRITGIGALRDKECDRLQAIVDELAKLGIPVEIENYGTTLHWDGKRLPIHELPVFDPHADHRMAMAFAPVSVFIPGIIVRDAEVVEKSYPGFWQDLEAAGFKLLDPSEPIGQ